MYMPCLRPIALVPRHLALALALAFSFPALLASLCLHRDCVCIPFLHFCDDAYRYIIGT